MGRNESRKSGIARENMRKKAMLAGSLVIAGIIILSAYGIIAKNVVQKWENKIYPGITIDSIDIGGMSKDEAEEKLKTGIESQIKNKILTVDVGDKEFKLKYSDINPQYDIKNAVENAFNWNKDSGMFTKYKLIKKHEIKELPINFTYDEEKLKAFEKSITDEVNTEPKNATLIITNGKISIEKEVNGKTIDEKNLDKQIKESLNENVNQVIKLELKNENAKITAQDLSKIKGVMGSYSTPYGTSSAGRQTNIELATKSINGTILMPGEIFSFNEVVGDRSKERGFQEAGTYVGNKVEPGIGGGICQVSSTLYRAAMRANLRSVERTNHSMAVGYMEPGLDATVSYGSLDYKFKNTYDFPIYIQGTTEGKVVAYTIYGDPSAMNGKTYEMTNEIVETIPPEIKEVPDDTLPEGERVEEGGAMTGYKVKSYQITYENGVEVNRELVSTDNYAKVDSIIKVGTMKPAEEETETAEEENKNVQSPPPVDESNSSEDAESTENLEN